MKDTIRQVSINLFSKKGYFATSISDIAEAAGIQKSSIYYHYPSKQQILFDVLKQTMADLNEHLELCLKEVTGAAERMRAAIQCHVLFHIERQKEVIISDGELRGLTAINRKIIIQMRDEYDRKFQSLIKAGIDEGVFVEADLKVISYIILTMCSAVSIWFRPKKRLSKNTIGQIYSDFILNALTPSHYVCKNGSAVRERECFSG
jgi:AcrR family transcriptional regulator